jgi:hypothetical protein
MQPTSAETSSAADEHNAAAAAATSNAEPAPAATYLADELLDNAGAEDDEY